MNRGLLVAFCLVIALPLLALAGLRTVEKHEGWQLTAGTKVTAHATYADCVAAAKALGPGSSKCKDVTSITVEATCDDEPKPRNTDAFAVQVTDTEWRTEVTAWVPGPGYPNCWVLARGELLYTNEAEEGAPDLSPGPYVYGIDYEIGTACPPEALAGCYVPPHPDVPPPAPPAPPTP